MAYKVFQKVPGLSQIFCRLLQLLRRAPDLSEIVADA